MLIVLFLLICEALAATTVTIEDPGLGRLCAGAEMTLLVKAKYQTTCELHSHPECQSIPVGGAVRLIYTRSAAFGEHYLKHSVAVTLLGTQAVHGAEYIRSAARACHNVFGYGAVWGLEVC